MCQSSPCFFPVCGLKTQDNIHQRCLSHSTASIGPIEKEHKRHLHPAPSMPKYTSNEGASQQPLEILQSSQHKKIQKFPSPFHNKRITVLGCAKSSFYSSTV
ncbi:hypothetical protein Nmel_008907 [Mimus melanotis]